MTRPTVFADLDLDAALQEARSHGKLLLVDATATRCGPCQVMDRMTWVAPAVVEALGRSAVAIQLDVDANAAIKQRLRIQAMPTVVAFRDGIEIDRVVGMQRPEQILAWLDGLARGETLLGQLRAQGTARPTDPETRMSLARKLVEVGQLSDATSEYIWLWQHMIKYRPSMIGVRHSFLVHEIKQLILHYAPARDAFASLREAAAPTARGEPTREALMDWFSLNEVFDEGHVSLAWFDSTRDRAKADGQLATLLEHRLAPMLVKAGRWVDVASLYPRPLATLAQAAEKLANASRDLGPEFPPAITDQLREGLAQNLRQTAGRLVRALIAAGRAEEARQVSEEARRLDSSAEMESALVEGMDAGGRA
jgi:thioredoxin-like negative regulator of GroEL